MKGKHFNQLVYKITFAFFFIVLNCQAQKVSYRSPLNIDLKLAGNFCEPRTDHFHSGIDIKTEGREGLPVFAVADGFISRIKISSAGFGKAIYITHPNHKVTVYAHLHSFTGALHDSVEALQYSKQTFEVEWFPEKNLFPVEKGQQIAWSGNSGGSEAPHLHFEIRDEKSEEPLNPLLNGWQVNDTIAPSIDSIIVYHVLNGRYVFMDDSSFKLAGKRLNDKDTLFGNADSIAIAFSGIDKMNDSLASKLGLYEVTLIEEEDTIYHFSFDKLNFNETRKVNAYIDYKLKIYNDAIYQRCFTLPGNSFNSFKNAGSGIIVIKKGETKKLKLIVSDANKNNSAKIFYIKNDASLKQSFNIKKINSIPYPNNQISKKWNNAEVLIPEGAFYEPIEEPTLKRVIDRKSKFPVIEIAPRGVALKKPISIRIKPRAEYNSIKSKLVIVELNDKRKVKRCLGGFYNNGFVTASSKDFGVFTLAVDTVAPKIGNIQLEQDSVFNMWWLRVKLQDDLSGISSYEGRINSEWVLFEYDAKSGLLSYQIKDPFKTSLDIYIETKDQSGNKRVFEKEMKFENK